MLLVYFSTGGGCVGLAGSGDDGGQSSAATVDETFARKVVDDQLADSLVWWVHLATE